MLSNLFGGFGWYWLKSTMTKMLILVFGF